MIAVCIGALVLGGVAMADGDERLGPPSIPIASGTGISAAGTGMISEPGTIDVEVPVGASIEQVLLYWEGFMTTNVPGDDTIDVSNGVSMASVTGALIGGPSFFFSGAYSSTFRADITSLGLVGSGMTTLTLSGLDFSNVSNGAGVLVIFDDGSSDASIDIRDGNDTAFINFPEPRKNTIPQTFTFDPADSDRTAMVSLFFSSVSGTASGHGLRPSSIEFTVYGGAGGPQTSVFSNLLDSVDGDEWDTFTISVDIPAGADMLEVQAFSRDDLGTGGLPASFVWDAAGFSIEPEVSEQLPGRMTGGGSVFRIDDVRVTRGFEIHCDLREPNNIQVNWPGNRFHMTELTGAVCTDSPAIDQLPRSAPFDTFTGVGEGKLNNEPGARIEFVFVDAGEPGREDTATIKIWDAGGNLVLDVPGDPSVPGYLDRGNIQAHKDNQSTL